MDRLNERWARITEERDRKHAEYMRPFQERLRQWVKPYWREVMKFDPAAPGFDDEKQPFYRVTTAGAAEVLSKAFSEAPDMYMASNVIGPVENRALRFNGEWIQRGFDRFPPPTRMHGDSPEDPAEEYYDRAGHVMWHTKVEIDLDWLISRAGDTSLGSRRRELAPVVSRRLPRDQARSLLHSILPDQVYVAVEELQRIGLPEDIPLIEVYRGLDRETDKKIAKACASILRREEKKAR